MNYEQEEEFLTNDLSRKLMQVGSTLFFKRVNILWSIWCLVKGLIDVYVSSILHCLWCLFCLLKKHWFFHFTQILWELHFNVLFSKVVEECVNFVSVCCSKCIMKLLLSQQRCIIFSIALHRSVNRSVLVAYKGHLCVKKIEHHWTQGSLWDSKISQGVIILYHVFLLWGI